MKSEASIFNRGWRFPSCRSSWRSNLMRCEHRTSNVQHPTWNATRLGPGRAHRQRHRSSASAPLDVRCWMLSVGCSGSRGTPLGTGSVFPFARIGGRGSGGGSDVAGFKPESMRQDSNRAAQRTRHCALVSHSIHRPTLPGRWLWRSTPCSLPLGDLASLRLPQDPMMNAKAQRRKGAVGP